MQTQPGGPLGKLQHTFALPQYKKLWLASFLQFAVFSVFSMTIMWLVTDLTESRTAVGLIGFVQGGVVVAMSLIAGVVIDRNAKRRILVIGNLLLAGIALALASVMWLDQLVYAYIVVTAVALGVLLSILNPASQTYIVDVVGASEANDAISFNAMGSSLGQMGGAAIAGVLIAAFGIALTFGSLALLALIAVLLVASIPVPGIDARKERPGAFDDLKASLAYVRQRPELMLVLLACCMAFFNGAISPMRPIFARHVLELDAQGFGALYVASGAGTLIMAVVILLRPPSKHFGPLIVGSMWLFALCLFMYSFAFSFEYLLFVEFLMGAASQIWNVTAITGFQMAVPEAMRGRMLGLMFMVVQLGFIGILLIGVLADVVGDQLALAIFGAIPSIVLSCILVFGFSTIRKM